MKRTLMMAMAVVGVCGLVGTASAKTKVVQPVQKASAGGTLDLEAALSHGYVPTDAAKTIHARIQVRADDVQAKERAPMNLAVVIDHSGSMAGGRLEQAKKAAFTLIGRLSEQDRLAVVSYGNHVSVNHESVYVTPANKEALYAAINGIRLRGSTNLAGGYLKGAEIVGAHPTDDSINRVVLMSDGHANIGPQTPQALGVLASQQLNKGVSVSTMGIGLDYNENIMAKMASHGAGNYYFVEDEKKLAEIFETEFRTLSQVVARKAKLDIEIGAGVELIDVHGFPHTNKDGEVSVKLGAFYAGQHKDILLELSVSGRDELRRDIIDAQLGFIDVTQENKRVHSRAALSAVSSNDKKQLAQVDKSVMRRAEQIVYAQNVARATDAYEKGEREEAARILESQKERLQKASESYDFDADKVASKVQELDDQKAEMKQSRSSSSSSGKRLMKRSRKKNMDMLQSADAF